MNFTSVSNLQTYINSVITTNGSKSISGAQLNTILIGLSQFMPVTGSYSFTQTITSGTIFTITIPLTFTPTSVMVQVSSPLAASTHGIVVFSRQIVTNSVVVQLQTYLASGVVPVTVDYVAFR